MKGNDLIMFKNIKNMIYRHIDIYNENFQIKFSYIQNYNK